MLFSQQNLFSQTSKRSVFGAIRPMNRIDNFIAKNKVNRGDMSTAVADREDNDREESKVKGDYEESTTMGPMMQLPKK
jgi:hypothetical protein